MPSMADVLAALGDPTRLEIVRQVARGGGEIACCGFAVCGPKATLSRHFRALRDAGILRQRSVGTRRLHSLCRDDLDRRFPGLLDAILGAEGG